MKDEWTYSELKAHYIAVRKRLGGLGQSAGLVPLTTKPVLQAVQEEPVETVWEVQPPQPEIKYQVKGLPKNNFFKLLMEVSKKHNIDPNILISHNRTKNIVVVRRELIYSAYKNFNYTQSQIARWLDRDHKTIGHDIFMWETQHNVGA